MDVAYDGVAVPGSPFEFEVSEGGPDKVKVYGKGMVFINAIISFYSRQYLIYQKLAVSTKFHQVTNPF